ncbi:MAG: hypothetical protein ACK5KQ_01185 [Anaerorhabdus sp.]
MKKILILLISLVVITGCSSGKPSSTPSTTSSSDLSLPTLKADMSGYTLLSDEDHVFVSTTMKEAITIFKKSSKAVVYMGYVGCPFCQSAVPIINEIAKANDAVVYYVDTQNEANTEDDFNNLKELLKDHLATDQNGNPTLYVPQLTFIKDKEIIKNHIGVAPSAETYEMSDEQKDELRVIYQEMFDALNK